MSLSSRISSSRLETRGDSYTVPRTRMNYCMLAQVPFYDRRDLA